MTDLSRLEELALSQRTQLAGAWQAKGDCDADWLLHHGDDMAAQLRTDEHEIAGLRERLRAAEERIAKAPVRTVIADGGGYEYVGLTTLGLFGKRVAIVEVG